jgi:hypothetical protein
MPIAKCGHRMAAIEVHHALSIAPLKPTALRSDYL